VLVAEAFVRHRPELLRFIASRLRSAAAAEDAVQEAYLRAAAAAPPIRDAKALLFQTAANLIRNVVRSDGRARAAYASYADLVAPPAEALTPERRLLGAEALARAQAAIAALPPQCRRVFELHRFEGLKQREVAERLGVSATMVEKHMRRAMAALVSAVDDATG
jgi:RNA polymerase sigma-70 factor (ECF subfamily)